MASTTVYNTFKTFLDTALSGAYSIIDFDTLDTQIEQGTQSFLVIEDMPGEERVAAMGDPDNLCMRASGSVIVYVFVPSPESNSVARAIGDTVAQAVRNAHLGNQIRILAVDPPDLQVSNNGLWTVAVVTVVIEHDFYVIKP